MIIDRRIPAPTQEVWSLANVVAFGGRPHAGIIHLLSIDDYVILQRSNNRFSSKPDVLFYPIKKDHELGQLAITPDTLLIVDESALGDEDILYDDDWFDIISEAVKPFELYPVGNDLVDEDGVKYSGVTEIINGFGVTNQIMIQCKGEDINKLLASDENKKRTVGQLPYTVEELADRIEMILRSDKWQQQ